MFTHLPLPARVFVVTIIAAGSLILFESVAGLAASAEASALLFVALAAITGTCMIKLPRIETRFSLSDTLVFTAILLVGPGCAAVVAAADALAASLRFNKRDSLFLSRTLFNVAAAAVSTWLPAHAYLAAGGELIGASGSPPPSALAWPLAVLVINYSLMNTGAIVMVVALTTRTHIAAVWRENFAWVWIAHAWSGLVAGAIAVHIPHVNPVSLLVILVVAGVGYATVRTHLLQVEESTGNLHKLNDLYLATIHALAMAIDAKDQVTHGHIRRVQAYAVGLARALGVTDEPTLKGIEAGALLHDTGKIAVPEHILNKPGKLTPQEYEKMKTHVTIGADILSGIDFPYPVIPYVRHHHENWDGTGYPDRLRGESIPLGARILSVVDCFDALTSDRPYRRALTTEAALEILRQRSGNMYDPAVVARFIEHLPRLATLLDTDAAAAPVDASPAEPEPPPRQPGDTSCAMEEIPALTVSGLTWEEAAIVLIHRLGRHVRFATAAIYVPRPGDDRLVALHVAGRHQDLYSRTEVHLTEGPCGWVAAQNEFLVNANPALDLQGPVAHAEVQLASALVVPFTAGASMRGALALYAEGADAFSIADAQTAISGAAQLSRLFDPAATNGLGSVMQAA